MDAMMEQCKNIKKAESNSERLETERLKRDVDRLRNLGREREGRRAEEVEEVPSVTREELDSPQLLHKFTRLMERQIGEAESLSRALGDALEERRQFQSRYCRTLLAQLHTQMSSSYTCLCSSLPEFGRFTRSSQ